MEMHCNAGAILGDLTPDQRLLFEALDALTVELLSVKVPDNADVEALAESIVAFYDGLADVGSRPGMSLVARIQK